MRRHRLMRAMSGSPHATAVRGQSTDAALTPLLTGWALQPPARAPSLPNLALRADTPSSLSALPADNALLRLALQELPHGLCMFDDLDRLLLANWRCLDLWQLPPDRTTPGTPLSEILAGNLADNQVHRLGLGAAFRGSPLGQEQRRDWLMDDGRCVGVTVRPLLGGGWMALLEDVTQQRQAEAQVAHLACHDELTGLPKRALLCDELDGLLAHDATGQGLAVICLDLDRFKAIIDRFGHSAADQLLCQAAARLRDCTRLNDMVVRAGGDEFLVLQSGEPQPAGANAMAQRMVAALAQPFELDGRSVHLGTSVGIAVAPFDGEEADTLLRNAKLAMSHAKADVRSKVRYFEPAMDARAQARLALESDLRLAVTSQALHLHYQPKVNLDARAVCGVEALLRWQHPTQGNVPPLEFTPLAEEAGLIVAIGRWALARACADAVHWPSAVHVAVNVSVLQFRHGTLLRDVAQALQDSGLAANRLEVEITETVMMEDAPQALELLNGLRSLGVRVAMDDFGTGFSSLSYLRSFPFDRIKIDRSFVRDVDTHADARSIVRAICALGRSLGMDVTAEGVETLEQLNVVCQEGCDEVQGYLFSTPRPACEIPALIKTAAAVCSGLRPDRQAHA